jgi:hypothetical protein
MIASVANNAMAIKPNLISDGRNAKMDGLRSPHGIDDARQTLPHSLVIEDVPTLPPDI